MLASDRRVVAGGLDIVTAGVGVIRLDSSDSVVGDAARLAGCVEGGGVIDDDGGVGEWYFDRLELLGIGARSESKSASLS